jgi:hypothetical protein
MKKYTGTKTVNATPMTRGDYNKFRGWQIPADENKEDEGYIVEYLDSGKASTKPYTGYVSWSPKDVFEKSYKVSETFKDRLRIEKDDLGEKLEKLKSFYETEPFYKLSLTHQALLRSQLDHMTGYLATLVARLSKLVLEEV